MIDNPNCQTKSNWKLTGKHLPLRFRNLEFDFYVNIMRWLSSWLKSPGRLGIFYKLQLARKGVYFNRHPGYGYNQPQNQWQQIYKNSNEA